MFRAETARQEALRRCSYLVNQMGTINALVEHLIEPGLSESWIQKFISGSSPNPTINKLDSLLAALDRVEAGDR